jgi:hypothetical protein
MRRYPVRLRYLIATRTPSATACAESRNTPADPFSGQGMSPNCVWLSKSTAVSSTRNPLTLSTSGEPPRGRGSIPHAGGPRHQRRCGAEIPCSPGRAAHPTETPRLRRRHRRGHQTSVQRLRFRHLTARDEAKDLRGGAIQPPLVNDQTHQRLLRGEPGP